MQDADDPKRKEKKIPPIPPAAGAVQDHRIGRSAAEGPGRTAAVRRNIMGGLGLMQEKIIRETHDQLRCNGREITAHANNNIVCV